MEHKLRSQTQAQTEQAVLNRKPEDVAGPLWAAAEAKEASVGQGSVPSGAQFNFWFLPQRAGEGAGGW